ncbi:hypothetical protein ACFLXH_02605 [Chloroflexota bacterium]
MNQGNRELTASQAATPGDAEAITHFRQAITGGKHWYPALLEAMGLWTSTRETFQNHDCQYLIADEAFDWLLLAERICPTAEELFPASEKDALLFQGSPPLNLSTEEVKRLIGASKYHQYLNYFYGVTVEGALLLVMQEEVQKERWLPGSVNEEKASDEAYQRIYGKTKTVLLRSFRQEKGYPVLKSISLTELKEFTYWLFKYRLEYSEKAKVASDTRKALNFLKLQWTQWGLFGALARED